MKKTCFSGIKEYCLAHQRHFSAGRKFLTCMGTILLGAILGYGSEWLEYGMHTSIAYHQSDILSGIVLVLNNFSIWIFAATLIAYHSWSPLGAGLQSFCFLISMCISYFIPKHMHYGYSVVLQFALWGAIALFSTIPAAVIWFSRCLSGWGIVIKMLPVAAVIGEIAFTVYRCIDYYSPIPGQPAEPLKWLLIPDRIIQLGVYILFVVLLILILMKKRDCPKRKRSKEGRRNT
ncbi:MAG: hypothetical protein IKK11_00475 [Oscillospiraceae bacterium]|nr:hypothetical protein [Oscillospiraceae bacterium]